MDKIISLNEGWNLVSSRGYTIKLGDVFNGSLVIIKDIYTYSQNNERNRIEVNEDTQLLRGVSYWIFVTQPIDLVVNDADDNEDDYTFSLTKGWNVINSPFDRSIDIDSFFGEERDNVAVVLEYINNEYRVVDNVLRKGRAYWVLMNKAIDVTVTKPELKEGTFIYLTEIPGFVTLMGPEIIGPIFNLEQSFESLDFSISEDSDSAKSRVAINFAYNENTLSVYDGLNYYFLFNLATLVGLTIVDDFIEQFDGIPLMRNSSLSPFQNPTFGAGCFTFFYGAICDGAGAPTLLQNSSLNSCFYQCLISNNSFGNDLPYWDTSNVSDMRFMFAYANNFNQPLNDWNTSIVNDMSYMFAFANDFNQPLNTWNTSNVNDMSFMFYKADRFNQPLNDWDTSNVNNMSYMFGENNVFNQPLNDWDTSNVADMGFMFAYADNFNQPLNTWNTSNVNDMRFMFNTDNFNQPLNDWNTSNVNSMHGMFFNANNFNQPLNNWDTSNVNNMRSIFYNANDFNQPLNDWNTSNVSTMSYMFARANNFNQPLNDWDTSIVTNMYFLFAYADNFNQPLNTWNTSNVNNMRSMFNTSFNFNQPLNDWDTSNVKTMKFMFSNANNFNQPLNIWNTSNVTDMSLMFAFANDFNQPLNDWNTSIVNDMSYMFAFANDFNQPLNDWDTSNVNTMSYMFAFANDFNQPLNDWDTSNVNTMSYMFAFANDFNQPLNDWNTSNVNDMSYMFAFANDFNQPLNDWNTSNVNDMSYMFKGAEKFNGDITSWDTSNVIYMNEMFCDANDFNQNITNWSVCDNLLGNATNMFCDATTWLANYRRLDNNDSNYNGPANDWTPKYLNGTFIYRTADTINSLSDLPIINNQGGFINLVYHCDSELGSDGRRRVEVDYEWDRSKDNTARKDGLDFYESNNVIESFGGIPLIREGTGRLYEYPQAFYKFTGTICDGAGVPTLLHNTSLEDCFYECKISNDAFGNDLPYWDTSNVTNMIWMFNRAEKFNQNINSWNTSNVKTMNGMFYYADVFNQPLNTWNTSNVADMNFMFAFANNFNGDITSWDTSNVTYMNRMFKGACDFNQNITGWSVCDNLVGNTNDMFCDATIWLENYERRDECDSNYDGPVNDWTSRYLNGTFIYRTADTINSLSDLPITNDQGGFINLVYHCDSELGSDGRIRVEVDYKWDTTKDETATCDGLDFYESNDVIEKFGGIPLIREGTGRADPRAFATFTGTICDGAGVPTLLPNTNLRGCFWKCKISNDAFGNDLPYWDTSNVTSMFYMFADANNFNQPLNSWNTSNVNTMRSMFYYATNFNQPLNDWNTSNVDTMWSMLNGANDFNQPLNTWDTCNVTDMDEMFRYANDFNQSLNDWNTSKVTLMRIMFEGAEKFNGDITNWDTSNVANMNEMFRGANDFNQDITNWSVCDNLVGNTVDMFCDATTWLLNYENINGIGIYDGPVNDWTTKT